MKMEKIQPKFLMMADEKENKKTTLYMHGVVGKGWFGDISSGGVREALDNVTSDEVEIHIHSNGGDAFEGIAICNYLRSHKAKVTAVIDGMAASAASLIAMGADKIIMPNNTMMMVHRAATFAYGNAVSLEKSAKMLRDVDNALVQTYTARFNGEFFELEELLDNETYMTAEQAKSYGFCDDVVAPVQNVSDDDKEKDDESGTDEKGKKDDKKTKEANKNDKSDTKKPGKDDEEKDKEKEKQVENAERAMRFVNALMESIKN